MLTNHFALNPDLHLYCAEYSDDRPISVENHVRAQGFYAEQKNGLVQVYHGPLLPQLRAKMVGREELYFSSDSAGYTRAVNSFISSLFCQAGFILGRGREFLHPTKYVKTLNLDKGAELHVSAHLCWSWDIEFRNNQCFVVPLPGRNHFTTHDLLHENVNKYLVKQWDDYAGDLKHFSLSVRHLGSGKHGRLHRHGESWHIIVGAKSRPKSIQVKPDWHLTLDMSALHEINLSDVANHSAEFDFGDLVKMVRDASPLGQILVSPLPSQVAAAKVGTAIPHLRFKRGSSNNLQDIQKLGLLEPPPHPVRLAVIAPAGGKKEDNEYLLDLLRVHLLSRIRAERHAPEGIRTLGVAGGQDTIFTLWSRGKYGAKLGLDPFDVAKGVHYYNSDNGSLVKPELFDNAKKQAQNDGRHLIAFTLMNPSVTTLVRDHLFRQLRCLIEPLDISTLADSFPSWLTITVRLAQRAGGIPWDLMNLPGADENTGFLGIDLGHNHQQNNSNLAVTLFDHRGRPINQDVFRLPRNDERIPKALLHGGIPRFIKNSNLSLSQVVVHRDGVFSEDEKTALVAGMKTIPGLQYVTLVSIKKDTKTRFDSSAVEGNYWVTRPDQAVLLTNTQAQGRSMPSPLEVELSSTDDLDLKQVVDQVYWLSRVYTGSIFHAKRLPVTTYLANNIATTGNKVHLKGWNRL